MAILQRFQGRIKRRVLLNFQAEPDIVQRLLPPGMEPKLASGRAVVGVCLLRLEQVRPMGFPAFVGLSSENAAHRIAVCWHDSQGVAREGVYIPRRDTASPLNLALGGRLVPGTHNASTFDVADTGGSLDLRMRSRDGSVAVEVRGQDADGLPAGTVFGSMADASTFFEGGAVGFSPGRAGLEGLRLETQGWQVRALQVDRLRSSFFADPERFPPGSIRFDCALVMRDVDHTWHNVPEDEHPAAA